MSFSSYFRKFSQFAQAQQKLIWPSLSLASVIYVLSFRSDSDSTIIVGGLNVLSYNKKHRIVDFEIQTWYYNILNQKIKYILSL